MTTQGASHTRTANTELTVSGGTPGVRKSSQPVSSAQQVNHPDRSKGAELSACHSLRSNYAVTTTLPLSCDCCSLRTRSIDHSLLILAHLPRSSRSLALLLCPVSIPSPPHSALAISPQPLTGPCTLTSSPCMAAPVLCLSSSVQPLGLYRAIVRSVTSRALSHCRLLSQALQQSTHHSALQRTHHTQCTPRWLTQFTLFSPPPPPRPVWTAGCGPV